MPILNRMTNLWCWRIVAIAWDWDTMFLNQCSWRSVSMQFWYGKAYCLAMNDKPCQERLHDVVTSTKCSLHACTILYILYIRENSVSKSAAILPFRKLFKQQNPDNMKKSASLSHRTVATKRYLLACCLDGEASGNLDNLPIGAYSTCLNTSFLEYGRFQKVCQGLVSPATFSGWSLAADIRF